MLIKETIEKQIFLVVLQKSCSDEFGSFTGNIVNWGLYIFHESPLQTSVIDMSF